MEYSDGRFDVEDIGDGLTVWEIKEVFISFSQIHEIVARTFLDGVGFGLAVTRKLRDANGARISVRSIKAVGSIFSVYVPVVAVS